MLSIFFTILIVLLTVITLFLLLPGPELSKSPVKSQVPAGLPLKDLEEWLATSEAAKPNLRSGCEAHIVWADKASPTKTPLSVIYLHGFSASWPETAPVSERVAEHFNANLVQGRLAGHGEDKAGMLTPAENWLQSVTDQFDLATRVGQKVIIVATSTGASLATWLLEQPGISDKVHSCIFFAPNYRIRSPFGFLLTRPLSKYWMHLLVGRERQWEPQSEAEGHCWTSCYSTLALIEMQKTVDFCQKVTYEKLVTPMAMMIMDNDPTVYPPAAIQVFKRWGAEVKQHIPVTIDPEEEQHVFVGDITAPKRNEWAVKSTIEFLTELEKAAS